MLLTDEDDGMLSMSILEHLEELRARIIRAGLGYAAAYLGCVAFAVPLWAWVQAPLKVAAAQAHAKIAAIGVMEEFSIIYLWSPVVASIFLAAPWVIYQVWAFIAPGLYPRERKWAAPFILSTAGLFVAGGLFAYYVALRYSLIFLIGLGQPLEIERFVTIDSYFTTFVNVMLGAALAFETPVVVFFLTLLRITTPGFLLRHSRYAVLAIAVAAAVVTPSPSVFDMAMVAVPMIVLFFLGVFASYLLVLRREGQSFPWRAFFLWIGLVMLVAAAGFAIARLGVSLLQ